MIGSSSGGLIIMPVIMILLEKAAYTPSHRAVRVHPGLVFAPPCAIRHVTSIVLAAGAGPRVPSGGVTRQGVVPTDLQSPVDCK